MKNSYSQFDSWYWYLRTFLRTPVGLILIAFSLIISLILANFADVLWLWAAAVATIAVLPTRNFLIIPIQAATIRLIKPLTVPVEKPFNFWRFYLISLGAYIIVDLVLYYSFLDQLLMVWLGCFGLALVVMLHTYLVETDWQRLDLNKATDRLLSAIKDIEVTGAGTDHERAILVSKDGRTSEIGIVHGNLGNPQPLSAESTTARLLQILLSIATGSKFSGTAVSFISLRGGSTTDLNALLSSPVESLQAVGRLLAGIQRSSELFLVVYPPELLAALQQGFSFVDGSLTPLNRDGVLAYLATLLKDVPMLQVLKKPLTELVELQPTSFALQETFSLVYERGGGRVLRVFLAKPTASKSLDAIQRAVLRVSGILNVRITVLPAAQLSRELAGRLAGTPNTAERRALRQLMTAAFSDRRTDYPFFVEATITVADSAASKLQDELADIPLRELHGFDLEEKFSHLLPILPNIEPARVSQLISVTPSKVSRTTVSSPTQRSSHLVNFLLEQKEEMFTNLPYADCGLGSVFLGVTPPNSDSVREVWIPLRSSLIVASLGDMGSGKSVAARNFAIRGLAHLRVCVIDLKPGDPYWPAIVRAAGGTVLDLSVNRSQFVAKTRQALAEDRLILYQADTSRTQPVTHPYFLVFLQSMIQARTEAFQKHGSGLVENDSMMLVVDELHYLLQDDLKGTARESADLFLDGVFKNCRDHGLLLYLISQYQVDFKRRNALARTLREVLEYGRGTFKLLFSGSMTEEQFLSLGYPQQILESVCHPPEQMLPSHCVLVAPNRGSFLRIRIPLTDFEAGHTPKPVLRSDEGRPFAGRRK